MIVSSVIMYPTDTFLNTIAADDPYLPAPISRHPGTLTALFLEGNQAGKKYVGFHNASQHDNPGNVSLETSHDVGGTNSECTE